MGKEEVRKKVRVTHKKAGSTCPSSDCWSTKSCEYLTHDRLFFFWGLLCLLHLLGQCLAHGRAHNQAVPLIQDMQTPPALSDTLTFLEPSPPFKMAQDMKSSSHLHYSNLTSTFWCCDVIRTFSLIPDGPRHLVQHPQEIMSATRPCG